MRSVHRVLLKKPRLQQATEAGDAEIWVAQVVAQVRPRPSDHPWQTHDGRTRRAAFLAHKEVEMISKNQAIKKVCPLRGAVLLQFIQSFTQ